jgi:hypothetical protein
MHIKTILPMLVYAALGATPAGAFEQQAALASTVVVRQLRGALVTADLHQGTTASCEENKLT